MAKRVTIDDVAELAGVHKATVSRALNASTQHQISQETIERVQAAAVSLGYVPNFMARGLRTSNSMTIGVVLPDLTNPLFPPIVRGIERTLLPHGYTALLANTDGQDAIERAAFESLLGRRIDGLIVATGHRGSVAIEDAFQRGIPGVMVNRSADVPYPLVAGDDPDGIRLAVQHLVDLGHRRILHISGPMDFSTSRIRAEAFTEACASHADVFGTIIEADALSIEAGREVMDQQLAVAVDGPTAVIAGNDLIALGALRAVRSRGLSCPEDISVIGFNDMAFAEEFTPPLTTVRVPTFEMGAEAARLLLRGITQGEQEPETLLLPVELVVRGSTGPVADMR